MFLAADDRGPRDGRAGVRRPRWRRRPEALSPRRGAVRVEPRRMAWGRSRSGSTEIPAPQNPGIRIPIVPVNCAEQRGGKIVFLGPSGADCTVPRRCSAPALADRLLGMFDRGRPRRHVGRAARLRARQLRERLQSGRTRDERLHRREASAPPAVLGGAIAGRDHRLPAEQHLGRRSGAVEVGHRRGSCSSLRPLCEGRHRIVVEVARRRVRRDALGVEAPRRRRRLRSEPGASFAAPQRGRRTRSANPAA